MYTSLYYYYDVLLADNTCALDMHIHVTDIETNCCFYLTYRENTKNKAFEHRVNTFKIVKKPLFNAKQT
jgi:hypothetical protein